MKIGITDALLFRFCTGTTTAEENRRIASWLNENPGEHRKQLDKAHGMYLLSVVCQPENATPVSKPISQSRYLGAIYKYAVGLAAALLVGMGMSYSFYTHKLNGLSRQLTTIEAPMGQRLRCVLNDGSVVHLNAGARLTYPAVFTGAERHVKLYGEAMFDVEHDTERPFVVETFACNVRVLGTRFNVIADQAANHFAAALLRGCVEVTDVRTNQCIRMEENTMVNLEHGKLRKSAIANQDDYLWTEGIISASDIPFDKLMAKLEKSYNVRIVIDRAELPVVRYQRCKIRVSDGIDHAMNLLQRASDFSYRYDPVENVITIR